MVVLSIDNPGILELKQNVGAKPVYNMMNHYRPL
jgi:hypothetical protein